MTNASRDTTTGLQFEEQVQIKSSGINLTKHNLYSYLKKIGVNWEDYISRRLLPDEAYFDPETKVFSIYEKKYQHVDGSADEKLQTCAFKIRQYEKLGKAMGAEKVTYTYVLSSWFKMPKYKDVLEYINTVPGCSYQIVE